MGPEPGHTAESGKDIEQDFPAAELDSDWLEDGVIPKESRPPTEDEMLSMTDLPKLSDLPSFPSSILEVLEGRPVPETALPEPPPANAVRRVLPPGISAEAAPGVAPPEPVPVPATFVPAPAAMPPAPVAEPVELAGRQPATQAPLPAADEQIPVAGARPEEEIDTTSSALQYVRDTASYCYSCLGHWKMAQAATTAVMLQVMRSTHRLPVGGGPEVMRREVRRIARDACVDIIRRHLANPFAPSLGGTPMQGMPESETTEAEREARAFDPVKVELIEKLPEPARSVFKLRAWCRRPFDEIARALGRTPDVVMSLYVSALRQLRLRADRDGIRIPDLVEDRSSTQSRQYPVVLPDEPLISEENRALQESLRALLTGPRQQFGRKALVRVARMVLGTTASVVGAIAYSDGPFDLLPSRLFNDLAKNPDGESLVEHGVGDALFEDVSIVTGPNTDLVIRLANDYLLFLGPQNALTLETAREDGTLGAVKVVKGQVACLAGYNAAAAMALAFPGGSAGAGIADFQISVLTNAASRIETYEGTVRVRTSNGETRLSPDQLCICKHDVAPMVGRPKVRRADALAWLTPYVRQHVPDAIRREVQEILKPRIPDEMMAPQARSATALASQIKAIGDAVRASPRAGVGVLIGVIGLAIAGTVMLASSLGGSGSWMADLAQERQAALGLPPTRDAETRACFAIVNSRGQTERIRFDQLPYAHTAGKGEPVVGAVLTKSEFLRNRKASLNAVRVTRSWFKSDAELVQGFWERVQQGRGIDLPLITPGLPPGLWQACLPLVGPIDSFQMKPLACPNEAAGCSLFEVTADYRGGAKVRYRTVVTRDGSSGTRPYIDVLGSSWGQPP